MAAVNLKNMGVEALLKLRDEVDEWINEKRQDLETQLARLASFGKSVAAKRGGGRRGPHPLKGKKRPVKFRDPATGNTWAGVGARPRWIAEYEAQGRSRDEFLVAGAANAKKAPKKGRKPGRPRKTSAKGKKA
ncbi:MAG: H-NS histone family protein [Rhizobiales bacterium]|jgi:DNA-binding protein H-NS|nr:H-NS histone family protein [Hyphomicrobiales bacterium]